MNTNVLEAMIADTEIYYAVLTKNYPEIDQVKLYHSQYCGKKELIDLVAMVKAWSLENSRVEEAIMKHIKKYYEETYDIMRAAQAYTIDCLHLDETWRAERYVDTYYQAIVYFIWNIKTELNLYSVPVA